MRGRVRAYVPGDEEVIQSLFQVCFPNGHRTTDEWRWRFLRPPEPAELMLLERVDTGEVVGHVAVERGTFWVDGTERAVVMGADFMVHPRHRGLHLTNYFWRPILRLYEQVDINIAFPAATSMRMAQRLDAVDALLGEIPQWLWWANAAAVRKDRPGLPLAVAAAVAAGCRFLVATANHPRTAAIESIDVIDAGLAGELDELSIAVARTVRCVRHRTGGYLRWRWREQPGRSWTMLGSRDRDGRLNGFAVCGRIGDRGRIVDLLALDAGTQRRLVASAISELHAVGCDRVSIELLDPRPWSARSLRRAGLLRRGRGPQIMVNHAKPAVRDAALARESWYLTIGDTDHV